MPFKRVGCYALAFTATTATVLSLLAYAPASAAVAAARSASVRGRSLGSYAFSDRSEAGFFRGRLLARAAAVRYYVVRPGDTLSSIAARYGLHWTRLWRANVGRIPNPNEISRGMTIRLAQQWVKGWWRGDLYRMMHPPAPAHTVTVYHHSSAWSDPVGTFTNNTQQAYGGGGYPGGSFGACVVARESGGNPEVMNATGHWGLYQFSAATWAAYGGNPADFGNAGEAEQNQVFANALAQGGQDNWSPYDGC
jgi:hypothetical protein